MKDKNKQSDYESLNLEELTVEAKNILDYLTSIMHMQNLEICVRQCWKTINP